MNINQEIEKAEMNVQTLIKDWHSQELVSFIDELIKKDRVEQLKLCGVGLRSGQFVCDHPESERTWRRNSDSSFCHKCSNIVKQTN